MSHDAKKVNIISAVAQGNFELVKKLVKKCIKDVNMVGAHGWTSLHIAAFRGYIEIVQFLLDNGASTSKKTDNDLQPLLYAVMLNTNGGRSLGVVEKESIIKMFIESGVDINGHPENSPTILHYIAWEIINREDSFVECKWNDDVSYIVTYILDHGGDMSIEDRDGLTPIDYLRPTHPELSMKWERMYHLYELREWSPSNHSKYSTEYRDAMRTLVILAKKTI